MIEMNLKKATETQTATLKVDTKIEQYDKYQGEYNITPSWGSQTLPTKDKVMTGNVTVDPIEITGSQTFTKNGTFDVTQIAEAIVNVPVGAKNFVTGSFTVGTNTTQNVVIPYEGNGYPIACEIWIDGGINSPTDSNFKNAPTNAIGSYMMQKTMMDTEPNYAEDSHYKNHAVCVGSYKVNSSPLAYNYDGSTNMITYTQSNAYSSAGRCVHFRSKNVMNIYTNGSGYSFAQGCAYRYFVVYSE